jgi:hypothetical protein
MMNEITISKARRFGNSDHNRCMNCSEAPDNCIDFTKSVMKEGFQIPE